MLKGQSPNSSVLRKCSVLCLSCHRNFSIDFWGVRPGPWTLYMLCLQTASNFSSDQIYPYQNKFFKMHCIKSICYFNWLHQVLRKNRKAVIPQAWHSLRPKLLGLAKTSWVLILTVQSPTWVFQVFFQFTSCSTIRSFGNFQESILQELLPYRKGSPIFHLTFL